jgi:hypothetical protein
MKKTRVSIINLMSVVMFVAIGLAALRFPSPIWASVLFTAAIVFPLIAILKSIACQGPDRLPWIGTALFGLVFLGVSFRFTPTILNVSSSMHPPDTLFTEILTAMSYFINPDIYVAIERTYPKWPVLPSTSTAALSCSYCSCCNSLGSLCFGLVGRMLGQLFATSIQSGAAERDRKRA